MNPVLTSTLVGLALLASPATAKNPPAERAAILATISRMEAAWNRGDFRGYMAGFKKPDVVFVSGKTRPKSPTFTPPNSRTTNRFAPPKGWLGLRARADKPGRD